MGSTLLVGASGSGGMGNRVYVYNITVDTLVASAIQTLNGFIPDSQFGASIYAYNKNLIVGAPGANQVYLYSIQASTGQYLYQQTLLLPQSNSFGQSVSMASNTLIIGASGSAYVFGLPSDGHIWQLVDTLHPTGSDLAESDFGVSVSMINNMAVVGDSVKSNYIRFNEVNNL